MPLEMLLKKNLKIKNSKVNSRLEFLFNEQLLNSKRSQVWVETVVYTLIGLTIIGIILSMAVPQIDKMKDKTIIEQTISALNILDTKITDVEQAPGNSRTIDFKIAKGKLEINSTGNLIKYVLEDTKLELSEIGEEIKQGNIILKTEKTASKFRISLEMRYENLNITYEDKEETKTLQAGATPYRIVIENKEGNDINQKTQIDFSVI